MPASIGTIKWTVRREDQPYQSRSVSALRRVRRRCQLTSQNSDIVQSKAPIQASGNRLDSSLMAQLAERFLARMRMPSYITASMPANTAPIPTEQGLADSSLIASWRFAETYKQEMQVLQYWTRVHRVLLCVSTK